MEISPVTQPCYVLLERLPAEHFRNKFECREAPVIPLVRECSVVLERLPDHKVHDDDTWRAQPQRQRVTKAKVTATATATPTTLAQSRPAAQRKRLGIRNGGVKIARNGRGLRETTVRQGTISRQNKLYQDVALQVTQRSAQRRGRGRKPKQPVPSAPVHDVAPQLVAAPGPAPVPVQVRVLVEAPPPVAGASPSDPEPGAAAAAATPLRVAEGDQVFTLSFVYGAEGEAPTISVVDAGAAESATGATPELRADTDEEFEITMTPLRVEVEPPAPEPTPSLLRVQCFTDMIREMVEESGEHAYVFDYCEKVILKHWLDLSTDAAAVYLHILGEPGPYIRASSVKEFPNALEHFRDLERTGFVSFVVSHCEVSDLADLLRKEELEAVAEAVGMQTKHRTKVALVRALVRLHAEGDPQAALVQEKLQEALGGCVRVRTSPRSLVQRALLLLSSWLAAPPGGDRLGATRRLLLQPVVRLLAAPDGSPLPQHAMFSSRQQALEWELLAHQRHELHLMTTALVPSADLATIAEELVKRYDVHVAIGSLETGGVGCGTMGNLLAETLSVAAEILRRTALAPALVKHILNTLLEQRLHAQQRRCGWVVALAGQWEAAGNYNEAATLLLHELDHEGHAGAHRAPLIQAARALVKHKLDGDLGLRLKGVLAAVPQPRFKTVNVRAVALKGSAPSVKRVYIHQERGQPPTFLSVEERVMVHFAEAFSQGLDDEGATLESLAVLAMWAAVYDAGVSDAWGSPCQDRPLDWGTPHFWMARHVMFEHLLGRMVANANGVDTLAADLCAERRARTGTPSLVRWELLKELDIAGLLRCITVPVFAAICRRIFTDFSSHRPGFPDLLLWNPQECKSLFVEVKGPNDSLRQPQVEWLSYLRDSGADVILATVTER